MTKIGIVICGRYQTCAAGKCLRAMRNHEGAFAKYPKDEELELVGITYCGGCPGGNIEYTPAEMIKNGVDIIHFGTCMVIGYPPCPRMTQFKEFIETHYEIPVVIGTHPTPMKYVVDHRKMTQWGDGAMAKKAPELFKDTDEMLKSYD